jgi:DNA-binding transcriptional LysR family regulator
MDLWQLTVFCRVVDRKSFSKAAEAIHLSQPTVSSHVKDLEDHFGCQLIDRLARQAVPTQAGRILYSHARRLLALRDETETAMAHFQGKLQGSLVVGGSTIPGGYLLPRVIGLFKKEFPRVMLSLIIADTAGIIDGVLDGNLEFGVVGAETPLKGIVQEKLIEDRMRLIVPAKHPWAGRKKIPVALLMKEPFIVRERGSGTLVSIRESLLRQGYRVDALNIVAELGSTEAVRQGIKSGVGVSILSTLAVADELDQGVFKALTIEGVDLARYFYLTRHRQRSLSPLGEAFIRFLKEALSSLTN